MNSIPVNFLERVEHDDVFNDGDDDEFYSQDNDNETVSIGIKIDGLSMTRNKNVMPDCLSNKVSMVVVGGSGIYFELCANISFMGKGLNF